MNFLNNEILFKQIQSVGIRWLFKADFYISLYLVGKVCLDVFGRLEFSKSRFYVLGSLK